MNNAILVGMAVVLLAFVLVWIMVTMLHRMALEKKIEKLNNITNPLPEEERTLNHYKELRAIEQSKVASAKAVIVLFMIGIVACAVLTITWEPLREFFGYPPLAQFLAVCVVALCFFCLPIYMGLALAGGKAKEPERREPKVVMEPEPASSREVSEEGAA